MLTRRRWIPTAVSPILVSRASAQVTADLVRLRPEIEPLVRLIEATPRDKAASVLADQLRSGVSYRQFLAALFLAGVRNINPRPPGFALHAVFIIHAAHLLSLEAAPRDRLLPLFFAFDDFKKSQERDSKATTGDYAMGPLPGALPPPDKAVAEFQAAMEAWDQPRAERAVAVLARTRSLPAIFEVLWPYAVRDYRNIGHKPIYAANAFRTLQTIGEEHAEPVLRSLTLSLLDYGKDRKVDGYVFEDQCFGPNQRRVAETHAQLPAAVWELQSSRATVRALVKLSREASVNDGCADIAARLGKGRATAADVWAAVHLSAAEMRMRAPQARVIQGIHALTSANGLHHAYNAAADSRTRHLILLQAAGWMLQFRGQFDAFKDAPRAFSLVDLEPAASGADPLALVPKDLDAASAAVVAAAADRTARLALQRELTALTVAKANEVHYLKYQVAVRENLAMAAPEWHPQLLAAAVWYTKAREDAESPIVRAARELL
ncbi:MAG: hypothetical protein JNK87_36850 [Bryobacterales bacterium]|nr:hypothetical protein [Bryobacterales bacterium]